MRGRNDQSQKALFYGVLLEEGMPDHSTFSNNRHGRFRVPAAFRLVFEQVLKRCKGIISGQ
jgi:transposase